MSILSMYHIALIVDCNLTRVADVIVSSGETYQQTIAAMDTIRSSDRAARVAAFFEVEFPGCEISFQMRVG